MKFTLFILINIILSIQICAQNVITRQQAIDLALKHYPEITIADLEIEQQKATKGQSWNIPNPEVVWQAPTSTFYTPGILIASENPLTYLQKARAQKLQVGLSETNKNIVKNSVIYEVNNIYNELQYQIELENLLQKQDSLYEAISAMNATRYKLGDMTNLERMNSEASFKYVRLQLVQTRLNIKKTQKQLGVFLNQQDTVLIPDKRLEKIDGTIVIPDTVSYKSNPSFSYFQKQIDLNRRQIQVARSGLYPGLVAGYLNQGSRETPIRYRFQFGVTIPVFFWNYTSRIKVAQKELEISESELRLREKIIGKELAQAYADYALSRENIEYFETAGQTLIDEIVRSAEASYKAGQIGLYEFLQSTRQAFELRENYINAVKEYNKAVFRLEYLRGNR